MRNDLDNQCVNAIRALSIDAIQKAKSGHPGLPLGAAAMGYELFSNHLKFNPKNPDFFNRDRFVLSAGHGTMLLYSLLHLFGYNISIEDIENFRQLGYKTPGHPETHITPGVDCSTGPLGQGIANAVGFAMAETMLAEKFNRDKFNLIDHYTYALCGEGCLMEGIANEAASLAGTLALGKLIVLYDCNKITIEGHSDIAFSENIATRHIAQGWQVLAVKDGNNLDEISKVITDAKNEKNKPSLIIVNTKIGYGSPKEGTSSAHGAPLGENGIKQTREKIGWNHPPFYIPDEIYAHCDMVAEKGEILEKEWNTLLNKYEAAHPDLYKQFKDSLAAIPALSRIDFERIYSEVSASTMATRKASSIVLNNLSEYMPEFLGGSADLGPSNLSILDNKGSYSKDNRGGRNIHFGVREHAMGAICNGLALHGGIRPYCATFFSFSDYMKNAVRMSAIMDIPVVYVFTHDSIGVGEDGPTHQPIEHLTGLRAMPNLKVFRPADACETVAAYKSAFSETKPAAIIASRQDLIGLDKSDLDEDYIGTSVDEALKGGYVVYDAKKAKAIILASGSEVALAIDAARKLSEERIPVRVVSMPCMSEFDRQSDEYKEEVLPDRIRARVAVEAGSSLSWGKYIGLDGDYVCIDRFGESAKPEILFEKYGLTKDNIIDKIKKLM
ncbi:MAG: transketolase [Firmicutes bacterium]|nr:transketolase [Bacillota bacterium]